MSTLEEFQLSSINYLEHLFERAKRENEAAYIFSLLGISSGSEDAGWDPFPETYEVFKDLYSLHQAPLKDETKIRLLLILYCHITESNFMYHIIYNILSSIEGETPQVFNFLDKYQNGNPPSAKSKVHTLKVKSNDLNEVRLACILGCIFDSELRNAVYHSDYILFNDKLRLKHKHSEAKEIDFTEILDKIYRLIGFFDAFITTLCAHKKSYRNGHVIENRLDKDERNLCPLELKVDTNGILYGFSTSGPLPLW